MDTLRAYTPATSGNKMTFQIFFSYFFDYAVIAALAIIYAILDKILTPFAQPFSVNNISLMYPIADPERIPISLAMVYSCLGPLTIIAVYTLVIDGVFSHTKRSLSRSQRYTWADRLWELNCGVLGLFLAQGAAFVITGTLKNLIGKPRPDLLARCILPEGTTDPIGPKFGLVHRDMCQQKDASILQDGFRSFPSGHSSSSFAGLFYLSLYLAAKLHVLDQRGEVWRTFIVLLPTLGASMIAGSRIIDARHHPFDVIFGSALGILCGWAAYRQYFPPVSHTWEKGRAYPMRTWGVPLRRPDGVIGTDGQLYGHGKYDRTVVPTAHEEEEGEEGVHSALVSTKMKPVRGQDYSPTNTPSFRQSQEIRGSSAVRPETYDEDMDYEHIRVNARNLPSDDTPAEGLITNTDGSPTVVTPGGSNVFRKQLERNQTMRSGGDEQDLAYQRPIRET